METNRKEEKKSGSKIFIILSVVFFISSCVLAYQLYNQKTKTETVIIEREKMSNDYESVKAELGEVQSAYEGLQTNNKQLQSELDAKREELTDLNEKLEKYKGDAYMITKLKKELQTIRNLIKSYLRDIDSLNTLNQTLRTENMQVKATLSEEQSKTEQLTSEKKKLSETVEIGSKLKALQLFADGIKMRGSDKEIASTKAKKVEKVRACFVLGDNPIAKSETKTLFMKVTSPDGRVLASNVDEGNTFVVNGEKLLYSAKKDVDYKNDKTKDVCMYFTKKDEFSAGKYKIEIYSDGGLIGSTSFELK